jgi:hypothetical protein
MTDVRVRCNRRRVGIENVDSARVIIVGFNINIATEPSVSVPGGRNLYGDRSDVRAVLLERCPSHGVPVGVDDVVPASGLVATDAVAPTADAVKERLDGAFR